MKVSSKIISGFLILMVLAIVVLANLWSALNQMQAVNRELSEINVNSATSAIELRELAFRLGDDAARYFSALDPLYDGLIGDERSEFEELLGGLSQTSKTEREKAVIAKLRDALDGYWSAFNRLKQQKKDTDELPLDLTTAVSQLQWQSEAMLQAVQIGIADRVAAAAEVGYKAQQLSRIVGGSALLIGVIIAAVIVRSINEPLRRLSRGTRAIAKGQFWHRLPSSGKDEFAELARDFNVMAERVGALDQMKKDFVSHVSHDLKAPLASIRQIMHLLLQEIPGSLNEQQKGLIQLSFNSAERLASMVGNLLDVSRMEAGAMEYRMDGQDIILMIKGVAEEFNVQARDKGMRFRLESDRPALFVQCDRERIVQVVGNLYENALKFSPANGEIVTRVVERQDEILVSVADSGPGVPDEHKERIFEKFHQVKHGKKVAGQGVGLGLVICKTIVEAHGGQIWVEDNPKGGSIFSFVLRVAVREEVLQCGQSA